MRPSLGEGLRISEDLPLAGMAGPASARERLLQGPIDCQLMVEGDANVLRTATAAARHRFAFILEELARELPLIKAGLMHGSLAQVAASGPIARRMLAACLPHATNGRFITAMAAVAGSVAEELIQFFDRPGITRAWVNNGGDIALHLAPGASVTIGTVADLSLAYAGHAPTGRFTIDASSLVRGIATSGWRGRSFSLGIADAVTILAPTASVADAAATVVANAVDVDAPGIVRRPANDLRDDSDLGAIPVTVAVPTLSPRDVEAALDAGAAQAEHEIAAGRIVAAVLQLQGRVHVCGTIALSHPALAAPAESR